MGDLFGGKSRSEGRKASKQQREVTEQQAGMAQEQWDIFKPLVEQQVEQSISIAPQLQQMAQEQLAGAPLSYTLGYGLPGMSSIDQPAFPGTGGLAEIATAEPAAARAPWDLISHRGGEYRQNVEALTTDERIAFAMQRQDKERGSVKNLQKRLDRLQGGGAGFNSIWGGDKGTDIARIVAEIENRREEKGFAWRPDVYDTPDGTAQTAQAGAPVAPAAFDQFDPSRMMGAGSRFSQQASMGQQQANTNRAMQQAMDALQMGFGNQFGSAGNVPGLTGAASAKAVSDIISNQINQQNAFNQAERNRASAQQMQWYNALAGATPQPSGLAGIQGAQGMLGQAGQALGQVSQSMYAQGQAAMQPWMDLAGMAGSYFLGGVPLASGGGGRVNPGGITSGQGTDMLRGYVY